MFAAFHIVADPMRGLVLLLIVACCCSGNNAASQTPDRVGGLSCSLYPPQLTSAATISDSLLLDAYNAQARQIHSLHAITLMRARNGGEYRVGEQGREIPAIIDFVSPDLVRLTGSLPVMSGRGFEMASDGNEFRLLVPEEGKKRFVIGPSNAPGHSRNPRENLRPQPLIEALHWQAGTLRRGLPSPVGTAARRTLVIDLPVGLSGPRTAEVEFNLQSGVITSLLTYYPSAGTSGTLISRVTYEDWRQMSVYPDGAPTGCFPRHIHIERSAEDYELDIHVTQIALNPDIPRRVFRLSPPAGIPVIHVDMRGNNDGP